MAAAGFDGSAISINVISSGAICIVEKYGEERNADEIKLSVGIIYCLKNLIHMVVIAVIDQFESDCPSITLLQDGSLNSFNLVILRSKSSNKEGTFIADYACGRTINDERYPVGIKGYRGIPSSRTWRCCQSYARLVSSSTISKEGAYA